MRRIAVVFLFFLTTSTLYAQKETTDANSATKELAVYIGYENSLTLGAHYTIYSLYNLTDIKNLDLELNARASLNTLGIATLAKYSHEIDKTWSIDAKIGPAIIFQNTSLRFLEYGLEIHYDREPFQKVTLHLYSTFVALGYTFSF